VGWGGGGQGGAKMIFAYNHSLDRKRQTYPPQSIWLHLDTSGFLEDNIRQGPSVSFQSVVKRSLRGLLQSVSG
jgi:hypothetical protein